MLHSLRLFKADIFRALGHPTRVAIVEYVRYGEIDETRLREKVGVAPAEFEQHLAVLVRKHVVNVRKTAERVTCSLRDPAFGNVLEAMREYFLAHLNESLAQLRQERPESAGIGGPDEPV